MANDAVVSWQEQGKATFTQLYQGIPIEIDIGTAVGQNVWVNLVETDRFGKEYKDNHLFYIRQVGEGADKKFYLNLRNSESLDYENPLDKDGNNIYNLTLQIQVQGNGLQPVASFIDMVLVVNNIDDDPAPSFPSWWNDDADNHWSYAENEVPVATISDVEINGKTLNNTFIVGQYSNIRHDSELPQNITTEELLAFKFPGPITSSITGGADADKFIVVDRDGGTAFSLRQAKL